MYWHWWTNVWKYVTIRWYFQEELSLSYQKSRKIVSNFAFFLTISFFFFFPYLFFSLSPLTPTPILSATKTSILYQGPACASWLEKDKTHRKASWLLRLGLCWQNTTNPWRRLRPLMNRRSTFDAWFIYKKGTTQSPFVLLCCGVGQEVLLCKQTLSP